MTVAFPPLVIPVFIPHSGCPHQCRFCNQSIITEGAAPFPDRRHVIGIIKQYLAFKGRRKRVELAFFGGNFLGLDREKILDLLNMASPFTDNGDIDGIRFSTRPDTITEGTLDLVAPHGVSLVELGVQSMDDTVLARVNRGHGSRHTVEAATLLKKKGMAFGVQIMVGLPGDSRKGVIRTAEILAGLGPSTARIYPLIVLKGTGLAKDHEKGRYTPLGLDEAVAITKEAYQVFARAGVPVIRMGLQETEMSSDQSAMIAGPRHPAFGHLVYGSLFYDKARAAVYSLMTHGGCNRICLRVHPKSESRLRGDRNTNLNRLKSAYPDVGFRILADPCLDEEEITAEKDLKQGS